MRTFFKYPVAVERLAADGTDKESYATNGTIYGCFVGATPEDAMISEGNPATSIVLLCEQNSDVKVGDRVTYNGESYIVSGVKTPQRIFTIAYKRCLLQKNIS